MDEIRREIIGNISREFAFLSEYVILYIRMSEGDEGYADFQQIYDCGSYICVYR